MSNQLIDWLITADNDWLCAIVCTLLVRNCGHRMHWVVLNAMRVRSVSPLRWPTKHYIVRIYRIFTATALNCTHTRLHSALTPVVSNAVYRAPQHLSPECSLRLKAWTVGTEPPLAARPTLATDVDRRRHSTYRMTLKERRGVPSGDDPG